MTTPVVPASRPRMLLHSVPPPDVIGDKTLRDLVTRLHELRGQAARAWQDMQLAGKAIPAAEQADDIARAAAVRHGDKNMPPETVHAARARLDEARKLVRATQAAENSVARDILKEAERVRQSPEVERLRAEDQRLVDKEAEIQAELQAVQAHRRQGTSYIRWLADPTRHSYRG